MAVADGAYRKLTPTAKVRIRELLKLNPEYSNWEKLIPAGTPTADHDRMMFLMASSWADDIKGDAHYSDDGPDPNIPSGPSASQNVGYGDRYRHRYWHFIDIPFSPDHTPLPAVPEPNIQMQIDAFRRVLASTQPDEVKSYDLVWLIHLVGDVHQPLHVVARVTAVGPKGDAGGNGVKLYGDAAPNLHAYWDDLPGFDCDFCKNKARCIERAVAFSKELKPAPAQAARRRETATWVQESFVAARTFVYRAPIEIGKGPYTIVPHSGYDLAAYRQAQKRIALAAARLAEVLNRELK